MPYKLKSSVEDFKDVETQSQTWVEKQEQIYGFFSSFKIKFAKNPMKAKNKIRKTPGNCRFSKHVGTGIGTSLNDNLIGNKRKTHLKYIYILLYIL